MLRAKTVQQHREHLKSIQPRPVADRSSDSRTTVHYRVNAPRSHSAAGILIEFGNHPAVQGLHAAVVFQTPLTGPGPGWRATIETERGAAGARNETSFLPVEQASDGVRCEAGGSRVVGSRDAGWVCWEGAGLSDCCWLFATCGLAR